MGEFAQLQMSTTNSQSAAGWLCVPSDLQLGVNINYLLLIITPYLYFIYFLPIF